MPCRGLLIHQSCFLSGILSSCQNLIQVTSFTNHKKSCSKNFIFCDTCDFKTIKKCDMDKHLRNHKHLKCESCQKYFKTEGKLLAHTIEKHNVKVRCANEKCSLEFSSKSSLDAHFQAKHSEDKRHVCSICDLSLTSATALRKHELGHFKEPAWKCEKCPHKTVYKFEMVQHIKKKHETYFINREIAEDFFDLNRCSNRLLLDFMKPIRRVWGRGAVLPNFKKFISYKLNRYLNPLSLKCTLLQAILLAEKLSQSE